MIMKYILPTILLLSFCLLCPPHIAVSAQEAAETPIPLKSEEYVSVGRFVSAANIRSEASLSSEILRAVPPGYPLAVLERQGDWLLVDDFRERKGWVYTSLLAEQETVIIKVWMANLRTGPGLTEGIFAKLHHGTILSVVETRGDWLQVNDSAGLSGWLYRDVVWPQHFTVSARELAVADKPEPAEKPVAVDQSGHGEIISGDRLTVAAKPEPIDSPEPKPGISKKPPADLQTEPAEDISKKDSVYSVHAGSFQTASQANLLINKLRSLGFPSFGYTSLNKKGNTAYVVVAGKYQSIDLAKEASRSLSKQGYSNFIAKAKDSLRIPAGSAPINYAKDKQENPDTPLTVNQDQTTEIKPGSTTTEEQARKIRKVEEDTGKTRTSSAADIRSGASQSSEALHAAPPVKTHDFKGTISAEARFFVNEPLYPGQEDNNASLAVEFEFYHAWNMDYSLIFVPFLRIDNRDSERTHFDIRELNFLMLGDPWELRLGIGKVFWGVTEFVHLIDIVNQTDLVENIRGEDKLGQPMVHLSVPSGWGVFDFFVLPFFRERTFPGPAGRLRTPFVVDTDNPVYESSSEENHVDFAIRYSHIFNSADFGIYYFKGTGRDPTFIPAENDSGETVLLPYYRQIDQVGTDLQLVTGNWLWKLEALYQDNADDSFYAATGGFEYTLFGLGSSKADLGIITEYAYDERDEEATTPFQNDLLLGLRFGLNDAATTEILLGLSYDLDNKGQTLQLEASTRLSDNISIALEGWAFFNTEPEDYYLHSIRKDDFLRLQIFYYF
jgi:SH3-like domain-containing protein